MSSSTEPKSWRIAYAISRRLPSALGIMGGAAIGQALITQRGIMAAIGAYLLVLAVPATVLVVEAEAGKKR